LFAGKPIIGIVGGIGSGKSFVADLFGEVGCLVIHSDKLVEAAYNNAGVRETLEKWWGKSVFMDDGRVNRQAVGGKVFANAGERGRLEGLLHPMVAQERSRMMGAAANDPHIVAFVWDSPLLLETSLNNQCDAMVFVDAPLQLRLARIAGRGGWDEAELARRENLQWPLDRKRKISEYVVDNTADADYARGQVNDVLFRIRGQSS
jgi:dephospho-CoA kinase